MDRTAQAFPPIPMLIRMQACQLSFLLALNAKVDRVCIRMSGYFFREGQAHPQPFGNVYKPQKSSASSKVPLPVGKAQTFPSRALHSPERAPHSQKPKRRSAHEVPESGATARTTSARTP